MGGFNFINASILSASGRMEGPLTKSPRKCICSLKNDHLLNLILRPAFCKHLNALLIMSKCSSSVMLFISISSRYARYLEPGLLCEDLSIPKDHK